MTTVWLVRHAEPDLTCHDDRTRGLTIRGQRDCRRVTDFFATRQVDAVLTSPFRRAADTVRGVAQAKALPLVEVEDLRERKVADGWIGDFDGFAGRQWADFDFRLPGGECLREVQARCVRALEAALAEHPGQTLVVGCHGTAMSVIINRYDAAFGWEDFRRISRRMPWLVELRFDGLRCADVREHDLPGE